MSVQTRHLALMPPVTADMRVLIFHAANLPLPPAGVNHQYVNRADGGKALRDDMRAYRDTLSVLLLARITALRRQYGAAQLLAKTQKLDLAIDFTWKLPQSEHYRRDIDGLVKFPQDCVCQALGLNDARIVDHHMRKHRVPASVAGFDVTLWALGVKEEKTA